MTDFSSDSDDPISRRNRNNRVEADRILARELLKGLQEDHEMLLKLTTQYCYDELWAHQEAGADLTRIPPGDLIRMLGRRLEVLSGSNAAAQLKPPLEDIQNRLTILSRELEQQRTRTDHVKEELTLRESQIRVLEKSLEAERQSRQAVERLMKPEMMETNQSLDRIIPVPVEALDHEDWFAAWQSKNKSWERIARVIREMGETGMSQSAELVEWIANDLKVSHRTAHRVLQAAFEDGLLDKSTAAAIDGRPPMRYSMSEKGHWLFRHLTGLAPHPPEHEKLLKAHKSEYHLAVILGVAHEFSRLGYQVEREPVRLEIEENRYFQPDLVVKKNDETYYLEVEVGRSDRVSLNQKWENALRAGGHICVAADKLETMLAIQGRVHQWATIGGYKLSLYLTHFPGLKRKDPGESPWVSVKNMNSGI